MLLGCDGRHTTLAALALPSRRSFLVLEKRGRGVVNCTTHELNALNARLRDSSSDCMVSVAAAGAGTGWLVC
jgi:hypothetical protein